MINKTVTRFRTIYSVAAVMFAAVTASSNAMANCDVGEIIIKFAHGADALKHPVGVSASLLAKRVNEEMNGRACMVVYSQGIPYDDDRVLTALSEGEIHLASISLAALGKRVGKFRIFDLPFLFRGIEEVERFQKSAGGIELGNSMLDEGIRGLAYWNAGMVQLSATKPLINPEDAKGLKFGVQASFGGAKFFEQIGASTHKVSPGEIYAELKAKTVDGQENTWTGIQNRKLHEVQAGITGTNLRAISFLVATSGKWWDELDPEFRVSLEKIILEVEKTHNAGSAGQNEAARYKIIAADTPVFVLTNDQRHAWIEVVKPVWNELEADIGKNLLDEALAANRGS